MKKNNLNHDLTICTSKVSIPPGSKRQGVIMLLLYAKPDRGPQLVMCLESTSFLVRLRPLCRFRRNKQSAHRSLYKGCFSRPFPTPYLSSGMQSKVVCPRWSIHSTLYVYILLNMNVMSVAVRAATNNQSIKQWHLFFNLNLTTRCYFKYIFYKSKFGSSRSLH